MFLKKAGLRLRRFFTDIKKYMRYTLYAAKSDLKSEVANSRLSCLWWVLEPTCFMLVYSFIVKIIFSSREPNFPVFVFIGLTFWDFFNKTVLSSVRIVSLHRGLVSKVYLPKYRCV